MARLYERPGRKGWWGDWTDSTGTRIRKRLSNDKRTAQKILAEKERTTDLVKAGLRPVVDNDALIAELWPDFRASLVGDGLAPASIALFDRYTPGFFEVIGAATVSDVNLDRADAYKADRQRAGRSARTINIAVTYARRMLAWAVDHNRINSNPLEKAKGVKSQPARHRRALEVEECGRLLFHSPDRRRRLWALYLATGMRRSEVVFLTWGEINFEKNTILLPPERTKMRRERLVFFGPKVADMLREVGPGEPDALVFQTENSTPFRNNLRRAFRACCKAAGIDLNGIDLQGLRRTFATLVMETGTDLRTAQTLIGHGAASGILLLDKYAKPRLVRLHDAASKVEELIFEAEAKAREAAETCEDGTNTAPAERHVLQLAVG